MINKNENAMSLLEIAEQVMKKKRKPQTLDSVTAEVFAKAGLSTKDAREVAQFELDLMLSGVFVYCGEEGKNQLWDLKYRQPSTLLDKDGGYTEDPYADDEDVINNELKDDIDYDDKSIIMDDDEEETEEDDIQEELGLVEEDSETMEVENTEYEGGDEDEEEHEESEVEDLTEEFEK